MFRKLKNLFTGSKKVASDDSFIRCNIIYNTSRKLIILVSFTKDMCYDVMEFCSTCTISNVRTAQLQSSYDEVIKIDDNNDKIITHYQNYLLISAHPSSYSNLYKNLSLSNKVLEQLKPELYKSLTKNNITPS